MARNPAARKRRGRTQHGALALAAVTAAIWLGLRSVYNFGYDDSIVGGVIWALCAIALLAVAVEQFQRGRAKPAE